MIFEEQSELRDFVTTQKKDYIFRSTERPAQFRPQPAYKPPLNALSGPYREQLKTRRKNNSLPTSERSEDPEGFLSRVRRERPYLEGFLPEKLPDEDLIEREERKARKTVYQLNYFKEGFSPMRVEHDVSLPENWTVPETIQKRSYRNPWDVMDAKLLRVLRISKPPDHLDPNGKEREIRRVTTGQTEYGSKIAATGDRVLGKLGISSAQGKSSSFEPSATLNIDCARILSLKPFSVPSKVI